MHANNAKGCAFVTMSFKQYGGEHGGVCVFLKVLELQREHLSVLKIAAASGCQMAFSS